MHTEQVLPYQRKAATRLVVAELAKQVFELIADDTVRELSERKAAVHDAQFELGNATRQAVLGLQKKLGL